MGAQVGEAPGFRHREDVPQQVQPHNPSREEQLADGRVEVIEAEEQVGDDIARPQCDTETLVAFAWLETVCGPDAGIQTRSELWAVAVRLWYVHVDSRELVPGVIRLMNM